MKLLVVGSVAFDSIQTPFGRARKTLGGSATYFALAASKFVRRPAVMAVVGSDFTAREERILSGCGVNTAGLAKARGLTFAWGGKYSFDLNTRETLFTHLNVFETFRPKLSQKQRQADCLFLGNIHPALQLEVLDQVSRPRFVGLDTMNYWIEHAPKELALALRRADLLVINDAEARELSGRHNLVKAARVILRMMRSPKNMGAAATRTLIIKRGEFGLLMFRQKHGQADLEIFHLPGFPLEDVIDPTGAGDSFAGGLFGYLSRTGDFGWANLKRGCAAGSAVASFTVERLGTARLQTLSRRQLAVRLAAFKNLTAYEN